MTIGLEVWKRYVAALAKISGEAADKMRAYVARYGLPDSEEELRLFLRVAYGVSSEYGEAAATLAAEMYDATALLDGMNLAPALPAKTASFEEVAKAINGTLNSRNEVLVADSVGRLVKMAGQDTTLQNALRDGAEYAWIATGDTCAYCLSLAAQGWKKASAKALKGGHAQHIHANCDCAYCIRFSSDGHIAGYDPSRIAGMFDNDDGDRKDQIDGLRRRLYAENRDEINAQKRAAYAARREREKAGE